jgi:nucleoside-diphosphate-sugar epimerase
LGLYSIDGIDASAYIQPHRTAAAVPKLRSPNWIKGEFIMRIFVTGATGFIGSAIVPELINAGHQVLGLARSEAGAQALLAAGAEVHRGDLDDLDSLRRGAAISDGVIHTAFKHDFSKLAANCEADRHVVEAIGSVLAGSARPLVITSVTGLGVAAPGQAASEDNFDPQQRNPRIAAELASAALVQRGVNVSVVRLSQVHSPVKQGFVTLLVQLAREKGVSAYVGDGLNRWPAVHLSDAARLYRLALEKQQTGSRYHAVAEEGTPLRTIAEAIGQSLKLPVTSLSPPEAAAHFGWLSDFVSRDLSASSAKTREWLGWEPSGPRLIEDLAQVR